MKDIKILVAYHLNVPEALPDIYLPIHVGEGGAVDALRDDIGDNISFKNPTYNELTAIYWAWKHYDGIGSPNYIGLAHYRRYFIFEDRKYPYYECSTLTEVPFLTGDSSSLDLLLDGGTIAPKPTKRLSVENNYAMAHHRSDIELLKSIIIEVCPERLALAQEYLDSNGAYYYNMFVMSKEKFFEYCGWMFPILEIFESRTEYPGERLFISEILTGIFLYSLKKQDSLVELPVLFVFGKKQKLSQAFKDTIDNFKNKKSSFIYNLRPLILWFVPHRILLYRRQKKLK